MLFESEIRKPSLTIAMYGMDGFNDGLVSDWQLMEQYFANPWILDEAATFKVQRLILEFWGALKKGMAAVGGKVVDAGKAVAQGAKDLGGKAKEVMKVVADKGQEFIMSIIAKIPGAEGIVEFLKDGVAQLMELPKMIGDKIKEWSTKAKDYVIKVVLDLLTDDKEFQTDVMEEFGLSEQDIARVLGEANRLDIRNQDDLDWWISLDSIPNVGLLMEDTPGAEKVSKKEPAPFDGTLLNKKAGAEIAKGNEEYIDYVQSEASAGQELLKSLSALMKAAKENPEEAASMLDGPKMKKVLNQCVDTLGALVDKKPDKYTDILDSSGMLDIFKTGFGYAGGVLGAVLSRKNIKLKQLSQLLPEIMAGLKAGTSDIGDKAKDFFIKGGAGGKGFRLGRIIKNAISGESNMEVFMKAMGGDAKQIGVAVKRIVGMVSGAVKDYLRGGEAESLIDQVPGAKELKDEEKKEVLASLEDSVASMFGATEEAA